MDYDAITNDIARIQNTLRGFAQANRMFVIPELPSGKNMIILVLGENKINGQKNLFGRNKYMSSVIVSADEKNLGKVVSVKIERSNQNSLFGSINNEKIRAA